MDEDSLHESESSTVTEDQEDHLKRQEADTYVLWANTIEGVGAWGLFQIRGICGGSREFAKCLYELPEKDLQEFGILIYRSEGKAQRFVRNVVKARALDPSEEETRLRQRGVRTVSFDDPWYPKRLRDLFDPPYLLYYMGELPNEDRKSLAIIGSRDATPYGREQARIFARTIAANGVQIVSGMARGIDGVAGRAALDVGGGSYAVLGGGPDICYPRENAPLYEDLKSEGGLISEYHPGVAAKPNFFPARNRIIAGLSDAVLVAEARLQSGTLITVDRALELGRDVFAVPGRLTDVKSKGCNRLIRQGAGLASAPEDLLEYFFGLGESEDPLQEEVRTLRNRRANIIEERQRAAFLDDRGRGPGYLHQLRLDEIQQDHKEKMAPEWKTDIRFRDEEEKKRKREAARESLAPVAKAVLSCLDLSTPESLDDILPMVREKMGRSVSYSEIVSSMIRLTVKDLAREVRVGYYIEATE